MRAIIRAGLAGVVATLGFTACVGGSGAGVPKLAPSRMVQVRFDSVQPRLIKVVVVDARDPRPTKSDDMLKSVGHAVTAVMTQAGIDVQPEAPNTITLVVGYPDAALRGMRRQDCVELRADLKVMTGSHESSSASSCFAEKNIYGMRMGNDVDGVYEEVVNATLASLDRGFSAASGR